MFPELFRIPGLNLPVNSYGFMIMLGFLLATYLGVRRGRELGVKSEIILDIGIISMIFGIIGAKINYVLQYDTGRANDYGVFDIGDGGLSWWGALVFGAIPYLFWWLRVRGEEKVPLISWRNGVLLLATIFFAILGARAVHILNNRDHFSFQFFRNWQSGFVLYGGLLAGSVAGIVYTIMRREKLARIADIAAAPMMVGIALGRIGCFLNGCCWGKPATGFPGVRFPEHSNTWSEFDRLFPNQAANHPLLHPTQIYETAATLGFFFLLTWFDRKKKKIEGETIMLAGICYSAWRFVIEFVRADDRPPLFGTLSYSQSLSVLTFLACAAGFWYFRTRKAPLTGTPGDKLAPPAAAEKTA